ncbi:MAG TPA: hypothetical protein VN493_14385 [Thermoanaerobaculia bacterium]|nr:hypothetical protein [Thermoanaerobaculia bacterium]
MPRLFRSTAAALALALMVAGSAQAGQFARRPSSDGPVAFLDLLRGWIEALRTPPGPPGLSPVWAEEGGIMDPDGRDGTASQNPGLDAGGIMDPNG